MTTAVARLDTEIAQRDFSRLTPETIDQVRRLVRHPEAGQEILYERLLLGCVALDEKETENRWQLWELLLTAYRICQDVLDERRQAVEAAETERIRTDPERRNERRRLAALNQRSLAAHLAHEQAQRTATAPQVAGQPKTATRHPTLTRRHRKETT